jgi:tryptophanyl-tRNA synthetase
MKQKTVMSGMRPTGALHLGHWEGALKSWLELQQSSHCYFSIVDWHAMTTEYQKPDNIRQNIKDVLLDWLSVGIDPEKSVVYLQSAVKEIAELFLLLSMITPLGWLERVPTFKEQQVQLKDRDINTFGFLGYPVLMTVDIIIMKADTVPVGEDQVFHLELAREIVRRFSSLYGPYFAEPMEFLTPIPKLPGLDGRKMSKSYGNAIYLSDSARAIDQKIRPMITDTRRQKRSDAGVPEDCPVFSFQRAFSHTDEIQEVAVGCRQAAIGCLDCKKIVIKNINAFLEPFRIRRSKYETMNLADIVENGNRKAGEKARETLTAVRHMVKL